MEEHTVTANNEMVPIKVDPDIAEEEDEEIMVGCDEISPKQCQKLQFSIAQIMGFDAKDAKNHHDLVKQEITEDIADEDQTPKFWRPLAQTPHSAATPASGCLPTIFPQAEPSPGPAALALLRHYTLFR